MIRRARQYYEFGPFRVDAAERVLLRDGAVVPLTPKAFDTLLVLVENGGHTLTKNEMMNLVWPDASVEEANLTTNISVLRKAMGESSDRPQYIETIPWRGYRFVASVRAVRDESPDLIVEERTTSRVVIEQGGSGASATSPGSNAFKMNQHRRVALVALAILVMMAASVFLYLHRAPVLTEKDSVLNNGERIAIAVVDFVNETGEDDLNGLSGMLVTSLEQSRRLTVLTRSRLFDILKQMGKQSADRIDEGLGREICNRADVSVLVIASIRRFDQLYDIDLKVVDPRKNEYLFTADEKGASKASIPGMIDRLSEKTRAGLKERTAEIQAARQKVADVTTPNLEAYRHYFLGEQLYDAFKIGEAEEEFKKALALDSNFALAYYGLAQCVAWQDLGLSKEPIRRAVEYIDRAPEKERYLIRTFNAYVEANTEEALARAQDLLKMYPDDKQGMWMVADLSLHAGDYPTAITNMRRVLDLDPEFEVAMEHIVWAYREAGDYDKMLESAARYSKKTPGEDAYEWLVDAYNMKADFDSGVQTCQRFLQAFPKSASPVAFLGETYIFKNDYESAEREFKKLLQETRPSSDRGVGYRCLAELYAYNGKYREAVKMIDRAIEIDLKSGEKGALAAAYGEKAYWLLAGHNEREEAKKLVDKTVELNAGSNFSYYMLFNLYLILGDYEKASPRVMKQLLTLSPFGDVIVNGSIHRSRGEYDAAIKELESVTQRGFTVDKILRGYELAQLYFETGENEKAIESVEKMQRLYAIRYQRPVRYRAAVYPRGFYLLGKIYEKKGDWKLALENYEKFLKLWKDATAICLNSLTPSPASRELRRCHRYSSPVTRTHRLAERSRSPQTTPLKSQCLKGYRMRLHRRSRFLTLRRFVYVLSRVGLVL